MQAVAALARAVFDVPGALVALVDETQHWTLAADGNLAPPPVIPRSWAPCAVTVDSDEVLVVPDLREDPRFCNSPLVAEGLCFYAGAPLRAPGGQRIGTVCVLSTEPRPAGLSDADRQRLAALADVAMVALEMRTMVGALDARLAEPGQPPLHPPGALADADAPDGPGNTAASATMPRTLRPGRPALGAEVVARIRALRQNGATMAAIAATLGIAVSSVHKALRTEPPGRPAPPSGLPRAL